MELQWDFNSYDSTEHDNQASGLSIIPVASNKLPFKPWAKYQREIAPISDWHSHYKNHGTVGIITGKISGNLECIDIDIKNDPLNTIITEYSDLIPDELLKKLIIQTTPVVGYTMYIDAQKPLSRRVKNLLYTQIKRLLLRPVEKADTSVRVKSTIK